MESQRSFLVIGLIAISFLLWMEWQKAYGPQPVVEAPAPQTIESGVPSAQAPTPASNEDVPLAATSTASPTINQHQTSNFVTVKSDTHEVVINLLGGDIISAKLLQYPLELDKPDPIQILSPEPATLYTAQSGLVGTGGPDSNPAGRPVYTAPQDHFEMTGSSLKVPLTFVSETGDIYQKTYIFNSNDHAITLEYNVTNNSTTPLVFQQYGQFKQITTRKGGSMFMPTYRGAAYSTEEERYEKYDFSDIEDQNLDKTTIGGWAAMIEHYFVSAWVPQQDQSNKLYSNFRNQNQAIIGFTGEQTTIAPNSTGTVSSILYIGPKNQEVLAGIARGLDLTVDYGFLWWLAQPLFWLLSIIQGVVINWGAAIVVITIIVKGAMYPLTKAQYQSMAKMRALAPKIQALKDRYGDDRQKMSQGMMDLYKKEKTNPMGGCFPLLLQMPIFLALYWVLLESVELRHASFIFWIEDLSVMDPYFVLPVLTGASMYLLQKLNPVTIQDPMQQKIMQWMPVAMSIFFLWFPAGLVLYWLISNVITLVQAKIIYAAMEKKGIKVN